jgi:hypothetical protein
MPEPSAEPTALALEQHIAGSASGPGHALGASRFRRHFTLARFDWCRILVL